MTENQQSIVNRIEEKYKAIDQNPNVHLEGLVYAKTMNYWDYIMPDALLALQIQRTTEPDEMVFVMYHQINELLFKMILWEINLIGTNALLIQRRWYACGLGGCLDRLRRCLRRSGCPAQGPGSCSWPCFLP